MVTSQFLLLRLLRRPMLTRISMYGNDVMNGNCTRLWQAFFVLSWLIMILFIVWRLRNSMVGRRSREHIRNNSSCLHSTLDTTSFFSSDGYLRWRVLAWHVQSSWYRMDAASTHFQAIRPSQSLGLCTITLSKRHHGWTELVMFRNYLWIAAENTEFDQDFVSIHNNVWLLFVQVVTAKVMFVSCRFWLAGCCSLFFIINCMELFYRTHALTPFDLPMTDLGAMNNAFLNVVSGVVQNTTVPGQARITQEQYVQILIAQLTQVWSNCMSACFHVRGCSSCVQRKTT